jgi:two-component system, NarL family, sensor histidine kinase UhpB
LRCPGALATISTPASAAVPASPARTAHLVLYRVAQEALTNVARHAAAEHVALELARGGDAIVLTVDDDGRGISPYVGAEARGITGMRERALLVHGRLTVGAAPGRGTRVRLELGVP